MTSSVQSQLNEKQTSNTNLDAITNLAHGDGNIIVSDGSTWVIERGATAQTSLGLRVGFDVQGYDDDLSDLSDGELSSDKVEHGEFFIPSAGTNGQVWTSDGDGVGSWGDASVSITGSASTIDTETLDASLILPKAVSLKTGVELIVCVVSNPVEWRIISRLAPFL